MTESLNWTTDMTKSVQLIKLKDYLVSIIGRGRAQHHSRTSLRQFKVQSMFTTNSTISTKIIEDTLSLEMITNYQENIGLLNS